MAMNTISQADLKRRLSYCPESGHFVWKEKARGGIQVGDIAGHSANQGYISITIKRVPYFAHRLAFLYMEGSFPSGQVDHINGVHSDNRWQNLRAVTNMENARNQKIARNNTSGCTGVVWDSRSSKWRAKIKVNGKEIHIGCFAEKDDAIAARKSAESSYGFHKNHGRAA